MPELSIKNINVLKINNSQYEEIEDLVAVEEPLEIRMVHGEQAIETCISVTMRTPGNDTALAAGFLFTEGILKTEHSIKEIQEDKEGQFVKVFLHGYEQPVLQNMDRNFYTTSSCGVCGKASIEAIKTVSVYANVHDDLKLDISVLYGLRVKLLAKQAIFERTGGLHACALFDMKGKLVMLQEDVGRHNALDKLIGNLFLAGTLPLQPYIVAERQGQFRIDTKSCNGGYQNSGSNRRSIQFGNRAGKR